MNIEVHAASLLLKYRDELSVPFNINVPITLFLQSASFIADLNTAAVTGHRDG
jgi:hypothetical protein